CSHPSPAHIYTLSLHDALPISHSDVPHAKRGWAYQRELELLVESGLTPMQAIVAGTLENARYFRASDRVGSVESGKLADLVLVEGNPLGNISDMRRVNRVMLNGQRVNGKGAGEKYEEDTRVYFAR